MLLPVKGDALGELGSSSRMGGMPSHVRLTGSKDARPWRVLFTTVLLGLQLSSPPSRPLGGGVPGRRPCCSVDCSFTAAKAAADKTGSFQREL